MCKEVCAINEETEKQAIELQLEIEAAKDIKSIVNAYGETLGMLRSMVSRFLLFLHSEGLISYYLFNLMLLFTNKYENKFCCFKL